MELRPSRFVGQIPLKILNQQGPKLKRRAPSWAARLPILSREPWGEPETASTLICVRTRPLWSLWSLGSCCLLPGLSHCWQDEVSGSLKTALLSVPVSPIPEQSTEMKDLPSGSQIKLSIVTNVFTVRSLYLGLPAPQSLSIIPD